MDNERRHEKRFAKKLLVNISRDDGYEGMGLTSNISKEGMFIATNDLLPIDSEVQVLIGLGDETITVKGKVVWSQKWTEGDSPDIQSAMGIKILEAPGPYGKLCE